MEWKQSTEVINIPVEVQAVTQKLYLQEGSSSKCITSANSALISPPNLKNNSQDRKLILQICDLNTTTCYSHTALERYEKRSKYLGGMGHVLARKFHPV